jgi:hypothetical protein
MSRISRLELVSNLRLPFSFDAGPSFCPKCGSDDVKPSRRRDIYDFLIFPLLLLRPFRCGECIYRYYGFAFRSTTPKLSAK